jgi:hypothetical protein
MSQFSRSTNGRKFKVQSAKFKVELKVQSYWKIVDWKEESGLGDWRLEKRKSFFQFLLRV